MLVQPHVRRGSAPGMPSARHRLLVRPAWRRLERYLADAKLAIDVAAALSKKVGDWLAVGVACLMFVGVRIGGVWFLRLPFSWGFGR